MSTSPCWAARPEDGGTGRTFEFGNVFVVTVREGLIVHSRDYQGR